MDAAALCVVLLVFAELPIVVNLDSGANGVICVTLESLSFDMVEKGILHIYTDQSELDNARKVNKIYNKAGLERWEVSPKECLDIEPALVPPPKLLGGFYNETDFTGDEV